MDPLGHTLPIKSTHIPVMQALFVPSGWHHSVENLEDTVSVNHNWINGFNVAWSVMLLCSTFQQAVELLYDCRCLTQLTGSFQRSHVRLAAS